MRPSAVHGRGLFTLDGVAAGVRVIEYRGAIISAEEAARRHALRGGPARTEFFAIDDDHVIDGADGGNEARWINHSCAPNCAVEIDAHRVWIVALRDLRPGKELLFDYALTPDQDDEAASARRHACACGAPGCRGTMIQRDP